MRTEEEIRKEMERCRIERDNAEKNDNIGLANLLNGRYWALRWILKEG